MSDAEFKPLMSHDLESPTTDFPDSCQGCGRGVSVPRKQRYASKRDALLLGVILLQAIALIILLLCSRNSSSWHNELVKDYDNLVQICGNTSTSGTSNQLYSPANGVLEDQIKVFDDGFHRRALYQEYSDESDKAWQDLYNRTFVKIPKSEAMLLPNKTWPIQEFPGYYIAYLDVFHQLHCVNKIRQALRRDRYDHLVEDPDMEFAPDHLGHCIESLRQHVMCHVDTGVMFFQWNQEHKMVRPQLDYPHQCKNFEKVRAWAEERHIDRYIDEYLYIDDDIPDPAII